MLNSKKEILLGQRSKNKKRNPLKWETTQGSVKSGEDSKEAAIRELYEELGINISKENLKHIQTIRNDNEHIFKEMFLVKIDINITDIKFTDGEVINAKWVDKNEFYNMNNLKELASNMDFNFEKIKDI